jgi:hypothetical protein
MPTENPSSNTEMVSILQPCPFCGGKADSRCTAGPDPDWFVECTECLASAPVFNEDKLDGWNMRAQPVPQPHPEPIAWMVGTAFWWTKEEAERDAAETGLPIVPVGPQASIPDGYCLMPTRLTAENGAKALLLGEFKLEVTQECPECRELDEPVEGCEICDGEGEYGQRHLIPWDKIQYIYSEAVRGLALKPEATSMPS